jgi:hypothetical protein
MFIRGKFHAIFMGLEKFSNKGSFLFNTSYTVERLYCVYSILVGKQRERLTQKTNV